MAEPVDAGIAARFTELVERANLTDTELGAKIGLHPSGIGKIRMGLRGLNLRAALRLCQLVGADPWYLAFGEDRGVIPVERDRVEALTAQLAEVTAALRERGIIP